MLQLVSCLRRVLCNQHSFGTFFKKGNSDMKVLFAITRVYHTPAYFTNSSLHSHVSANSLRTYPGFCLDLFCFLLSWRPLSVGLGSWGCRGLNRRRLDRRSAIRPPPPEELPAQLTGLRRLVSKRNSNFTGTS